MKRIFLSVAILFVAGARPVWAQQSEIAALRAEVAKQQAVIEQLLQRLQALEAQQQPPPAAVTNQELQDEIKAQEDSVNSLREIVSSRVNLNGYYNFRFAREGSDEPMAFQQHHLGVVMANIWKVPTPDGARAAERAAPCEITPENG